MAGNSTAGGGGLMGLLSALGSAFPGLMGGQQPAPQQSMGMGQPQGIGWATNDVNSMVYPGGGPPIAIPGYNQQQALAEQQQRGGSFLPAQAMAALGLSAGSQPQGIGTYSPQSPFTPAQLSGER